MDENGSKIRHPTSPPPHESLAPSYVSGLELSSVHNGLQLSPAENDYELNRPQFLPNKDEKTGLGIRTSFFGFSNNGGEKGSNNSRLRRKQATFWVCIVLAVVVIIALAIALPIHFTRRHHTPSESKASNVSATGAYNGTGLVFLELGTSYNDYTYHLYYQHSSGEIRDLQLNNYEWVPAAYTNVGLPASVKNGTPMAVASYEDSEPYPTYHIYYVDSAGILQETTNAEGKGNWHRGPLGTLNITPSQGTSVGLTACSNERWNGDNITKNERIFELYYGASDNLVHELIYNFGTNAWTPHFSFPDTNGNAGIACSASNTSLSYVFLSNAENELEIWWKDSNDTEVNSAANTTAHPLGAWTKVSDPAPVTIHPNSSISRIRTSDTNDLIFFQDPSYAIKALQPVLSAENSSWGSILNIGSAVAGPGSQMAAGTLFQGDFSTVPNITDSEYKLSLGFHLFFQTSGNDITEFIRPYAGGQWTSDSLPGL